MPAAPPFAEPVPTTPSSATLATAAPALVPETAKDTPLPPSDTPITPESPAVAPRTGRAARLLAEDAADAAPRQQRWKGFDDTPAAEPTFEEPSPPKPARGGRTAAWLGVGIILIAGAVILAPRLLSKLANAPRPPASAPVVQDVAPASPSGDLAALTARLSALENRPTADSLRQELDQRLANAPARAGEARPEALKEIGDVVGSQAGQLAALAARIANLEAALGNAARLDEMTKRLAALEGKTADAASVLALSDRVTAVEAMTRTAAAEQSVRVATLLAVAQWREALAAGRPFVLEWESVRVLTKRSGQTVDDARFAARAGSGIASLAMLRERFDDTAAQVLRAAAVPNGVSGWLARVFERMLSIVTIRRVDGLVEGNTPEAILARTGVHLRDGNLAAAVTEMEALSGPAAGASQTRRDEARARVAAEDAATELTTKAVAALGAAAKSQAEP